jgi:hypothetical protein
VGPCAGRTHSGRGHDRLRVVVGQGQTCARLSRCRSPTGATVRRSVMTRSSTLSQFGWAATGAGGAGRSATSPGVVALADRRRCSPGGGADQMQEVSSAKAMRRWS